MKTTRFSCYGISILAALSIAVGASEARADQAADVKAAGRAIAEMLVKGDATAVKKHCISNEKVDKMVDAMAGLAKAQKKLADAGEARFGESGKSLASGAAQRDWKKQIDDADVKIDGDSATLTPKPPKADKPDAPAPRARPAAQSYASYFKKTGGEWKMDMTRMPGLEAIDQMVKMFGMMTKTMNETADEIKAGKYKTAQDAKQAMQAKTMAAIQGEAASPNGAADGADGGGKDSNSDK